MASVDRDRLARAVDRHGRLFLAGFYLLNEGRAVVAAHMGNVRLRAAILAVQAAHRKHWRTSAVAAVLPATVLAVSPQFISLAN
jgi:hypothetical protein